MHQSVLGSTGELRYFLTHGQIYQERKKFITACSHDTKAATVRTKTDTMASTTQKLIIALATIALLLGIVTITLWQTGVIFSSSAHMGSSANDSARYISKDANSGAIRDTTMSAESTTLDTGVANSGINTVATAVPTEGGMDATNNDAEEISHDLPRSAIDDASNSHTIFFATIGSGIKALSTETAQVTPVIDSTKNVYGVAYDAGRNKLYWTSDYKMYRSEADGTHEKELLDTTKLKQCK